MSLRSPHNIIRLGLVMLGLLLEAIAIPAAARVCATDDSDQQICLDKPAERIAALSPGATELLYAAGAGKHVVAVVSYSDYPPAARQLPSVGSHTRLDLERLAALKPDLAIGWRTGNSREQLAQLSALGIPVFTIEPRTFEDISTTLERLARLAGSEAEGHAAAEAFRTGMARLAKRYADATPVPVFYEVWNKPLMTINNAHLIGKVVSLCGGVNIFGQLDRLVPRIGVEAVLAANPEAIVAGGMGEENRAWLTAWEQYPNLKAVAHHNLFLVPPSLIQRPTPRLLEGSRILCEKLEEARARH